MKHNLGWLLTPTLPVQTNSSAGMKTDSDVNPDQAARATALVVVSIGSLITNVISTAYRFRDRN